MHNRIAHLYSHVQLAGNKTPFKKVKDAFDKAAKYVHTKGSFSSDDLAHKDVRPLIDETNNVLKTAFSKTIETEMPAAMLQKLQDDVFLFSGMKTYTQLKEASLLLTDANKNIKSWELFRNDIQKIDSTYNENYLRAEHQHAVAAVQSAAQYHEYMQDADRYNLQIRTAGDDRVRASHAALNGITRPANDAYWNTTWTPFDWGCRCRIIQVLKGKYEVTDAEIANKAAASAVGELFRYNPGKEQVVFPEKHPYYKASKEAQAVVKKIEAAPLKNFVPGNIEDYEKATGVTVDKGIFDYLSKKVSFEIHGNNGAYYQPSANKVVIPIDKRRLGSKWYAEAVVYHEFGHAADHHYNFKGSDKVKDLMDKYRKLYKADKEAGYKALESKILTRRSSAVSNDDYEKIDSMLDTLMALNKKYGTGHPISYFNMPGKPEAEFIAHAFENKFAGNNIFSELAPELYKDMIKMIEDIKQ